MYDHYYGSSASNGFEAFIALIILLIAIAVIICWILAISMLVKAAKQSGYPEDKVWRLWLIGICTTPLVLGICVVVFQLSQIASASSTQKGFSHQNGASELPPL